MAGSYLCAAPNPGCVARHAVKISHSSNVKGARQAIPVRTLAPRSHREHAPVHRAFCVEPLQNFSGVGRGRENFEVENGGNHVQNNSGMWDRTIRASCLYGIEAKLCSARDNFQTRKMICLNARRRTQNLLLLFVSPGITRHIQFLKNFPKVIKNSSSF